MIKMVSLEPLFFMKLIAKVRDNSKSVGNPFQSVIFV